MNHSKLYHRMHTLASITDAICFIAVMCLIGTVGSMELSTLSWNQFIASVVVELIVIGASVTAMNKIKMVERKYNRKHKVVAYRSRKAA